MADPTSLIDALGGERPTTATALHAVSNDLFPVDHDQPIPGAGLNGVFDLDGASVEFQDAFAEDDIEGMLAETLSAVPWQVRVKHTGEFRGIPATGRLVTIVGVSILNLTSRPGIIHRFINWEEVMVQLGVVYAARASASEPPAPTP